MKAVVLSSVSTKVPPEISAPLSDQIVQAIKVISKSQMAKDGQLDLHMVEIMHMKAGLGTDTRFVNGLVLDHGGRHASMPKRLENCYILTCNVTLEYEKSEVNSSFVYSSAEQKALLVRSERKVIDDRCHQIVELKNKVCPPGSNKNFVVINQKGIDLPSLDILAKANILGLRRAKRRNMERLTLACGGSSVFDFTDLGEADLGYADLVYEHVLGEEKYTFVEGCKDPASCTILVQGSYDHTINQIKDAIRDGLRSVFNTIRDGCLLPGAGAVEIACHRAVLDASRAVEGKKKLGVRLFADALLSIPRQLAKNAGLDADEAVMQVLDAQYKGEIAGLDLDSGKPMDPVTVGVYDNFSVKRNMITSAATIASQLLIVDEILKAGSHGKG
eukprot:NODE_904_length_1707_cov_74.579614_g737_i0.p2 GENE.NODE_904_length_1707_cov_74.579614_g737_i0~~NODE_904_length_1707_cov_74.579614_g737_i0.p2  ORF type:complete len:388 (+),score=144.74 NODE_904_length_1707_cov_74.579614_g737_i0:502-1665(+)